MHFPGVWENTMQFAGPGGDDWHKGTMNKDMCPADSTKSQRQQLLRHPSPTILHCYFHPPPHPPRPSRTCPPPLTPAPCCSISRRWRMITACSSRFHPFSPNQRRVGAVNDVRPEATFERSIFHLVFQFYTITYLTQRWTWGDGYR